MAGITSFLNNNQPPATSGASGTSGGATSKSKIDASKLMGTTDQFLNILLAQLKHQDPLEPMKGTEFIDSISRLSGVEQSINTNTNLENIASILQKSNSQLGSPVSYIDKTIEFNSSQIELKDGFTEFSYDVPEGTPVSDMRLVIKDSGDNVVVDSLVLAKEGVNNNKWDGTDLNGNQLPDGNYSVYISYPDPASKDPSKPDYLSLPTYTKGTVTEANFTGEEPTITVGGVEIPLSAVRKLYSSTTQS